MRSPRVSIVVPTANRADALAATLETLLAQEYPAADHELLVVENGPEAGARAIAARAAAAHPERAVSFFHEPVPGLLSGRHRGALEARGEVLVFVDDDIDASPGWLAAVGEAFADPRIDLAGGPSLPRLEAPPPPWLADFWWTPPGGVTACGYLSLIDYGDRQLEIDPNHIWGLNFAIRREALFDLGGFHPDCLPDELQHFQGDGETGLTLKAQAAGVKGHYLPRMRVYHRIPAGRLTEAYFLRRALYQGVCDSYTAIRRAGGVPVGATVGSADAAPRRRFLDRATERLRDWLHPPHVARAEANRSGDVEKRDGEAFLVGRGKDEVSATYNAGYITHQEAVGCSSALLAWVLRKDYWEYRLPELESPRFRRLRIELQQRAVRSHSA